MKPPYKPTIHALPGSSLAAPRHISDARTADCDGFRPSSHPFQAMSCPPKLFSVGLCSSFIYSSNFQNKHYQLVNFKLKFLMIFGDFFCYTMQFSFIGDSSLKSKYDERIFEERCERIWAGFQTENCNRKRTWSVEIIGSAAYSSGRRASINQVQGLQAWRQTGCCKRLVCNTLE